MAEIKPFLCIRPREDMASKIAALPYDVYNREEAKKAVENQPDSFLNIDRAETGLDDSVDTYSPEVYKRAHDLLWKMVEEKKFVKEEKECYFIYELTMNGRVQTGITACASIDDYKNEIIKKHENTRADKERDRINHVDICNAQTGPIFLAYRSNKIINDIVSKNKEKAALFDFVAEDGIRHRVFKIDEDSDIKQIRDTFDSIHEIYIADGHHRAASAVKVGEKRRREHPSYTGKEEFNYFLSVLFPDDQLMIMDYNRVLKDMNGHTDEELLKFMQDRFEMGEPSKEPLKPEKKGYFSFLFKGRWYPVRFHDDDMTNDPVKGLDVSLLQDLLLKPFFGIEDPKTDKRIDFVGGIRGLKELERRTHTDSICAFAMYPTSITELFSVADAGRLMPPKSTWFEPKLRSGLFIHEI